MSLKKSIALIMGIVLLLTVVSGAFLYNQSNRNTGGVTSTNEVKYDYVVDNSYAYVKDVDAGARNGELKTVGSVCYEYSKILLNVTPNQTVTQAPSQIIDPNNHSAYMFRLEMPMEITITSSGAPNYKVYLCWSGSDDPEDPPKRYLAGTGSKIIVDEYPEGYGSEDCWLEIESPQGAVTIRRIVVQMVPYADSSPVTQVIATSKNLIDYRGATLRDGKTLLTIVDNGVIMPAGETYYIVIPVSNIPGNNYYTVSYSGTNELGESVGKYVVHYKDGSYSSSYNNGVGVYHTSEIDAIWIYKADPGKDNPLQGDLTITNIQLEIGIKATEYTPWFEDRTILTVPDAILNLPGYGVGSLYGLYNYLDLSNGTYVQTCKLVDGDIVILDAPKVMDVSHYLPPGGGKIDLFGVGSLIYVNSHNLDVPSELTYRRIIN